MFTSIELVWSSALWCFLGRYTVLKHWSGCLSEDCCWWSLIRNASRVFQHHVMELSLDLFSDKVRSRSVIWHRLFGLVSDDRRTDAWGCYSLAGWQASTLLTDAWWDRNRHAAKTSRTLSPSTSWSKAEACFSLYEDVNRERSSSTNLYLHISHERKADDLSKWKITSTRLNGAHAWRTPACVCVCVLEVPNGSSRWSWLGGWCRIVVWGGGGGGDGW